MVEPCGHAWAASEGATAAPLRPARWQTMQESKSLTAEKKAVDFHEIVRKLRVTQ
jgi:hypothetical protein